MNTKYFALLTHAGTGKLEKAASSGHKLEITHMAVGDGGGSLVTPHASQSKLINEIHRAEINTFTINPQNSNQIIAEQIIPEGKGNWWIREMGLFDKDGTLIAVGNCADLYKPESQEQTIHMNLTVSGNGLTDWIKGLISGLATRQYVRDKIKEHTESRNHPDATLTQKGFVALNSAVNSDAETHAATPKAIKTAYELANKAYELATTISSTDKYVPVTRKINGKELSRDIGLTAQDVDAYDKIQTNSLVDGAKHVANTAIDIANTKVPLSRKVNGKELVNDVELSALDVNAYSRQDTDGLIETVNKLANTANQNAIHALKQAEQNVPQTRKVNNKELTTDIQLTVDDIGTYNKKEIEDRISTVQLSAETANKNATTAIQQAEKSVPLTRKVNNKELVTDIHLTAGDIGTYDKKDIEDRISTVQLSAETANKNATTAIQQAEKSVPLTRKVNNKELVTDIHLTAGDIGTYDKKDIEDRISTVQLSAETANKNATTAIQQAEKSVPSIRKVNNKELVTDIHLTAGDIGTYDKKEIEDRIGTVQLSAETANKNATTAIQQAEKSVPLTRKVNNKELVTDIHLTAGDIGTYDKKDIEARIGTVQLSAETANKNATTAIQQA
ncbi:phage tail protein, partial [Xenorhabdus hominickii]